MTMMLEVKGLTKRFGGLLAVSAVDLAVAKGARVPGSVGDG
jgi:ABC-type branched-subunit amino acid transport system ATPase component